MRGVLFCSDALALIAAMAGGLLIRTLLGAPQPWALYCPLLMAVVLFVPPVYFLLGVFPCIGTSRPAELRSLTLGTSLVFFFVFVFSFFSRAPIFFQFSRLAVCFVWGFALLTVPLGRAITYRLAACTDYWGVKVIVIGKGKLVQDLVRDLRNNPECGYKPAALLSTSSQEPRDEALGLAVLTEEQLQNGGRLSGTIHGIVPIGSSQQLSTDPETERLTRLFHYLVYVPMDFSQLGSMVVTRDLGGVLGLEVGYRLLHFWPNCIKRCLELALVILLGIVCIPLLLLFAILIKVTSPGPVFFSQPRVGTDGKPFQAYKFRSMYVDAEERLATLLADDAALREEYDTFRKLRKDPRVTPVGRLMRRFSLDEVPQFLNVLTGEMNLVGPRSYLQAEVASLQGAEDILFQVRPGITGLWQVSGRNQLTFQERVDIEVSYIRNWSIWLDLSIIARTFAVVVLGRGAY